MMARRYWRDVRGQWRNGNGRFSSGPRNKVDLRKYPKRKSAPPRLAHPDSKSEKKRLAHKGLRRARPFKPQSDDQLCPLKVPRLAIWNSPFRRFVEALKGPLREDIRCYVLLKVTSAEYQTRTNREGVRIFARLFDTRTRVEALTLTVGEVRRNVERVDNDGVLWAMQAKDEDTRREIANEPQMRRYLRAVDRQMPSAERRAAEAIMERLSRGKKTQKGKRRTRYTAMRGKG